ELELLARPVRALTLRASLGYLDTKYKNNQLLSGVDVGGNRIPFASKWTASFGGDLTVAEIGTGKLVASAEVAYKSSIWYDAFNDNQRPDPTALYGPNDRTDLVGSHGYALVNGRLSYSTDKFTVAVWGKNILDKKYYPFGYDTAGAFGTVLLTPGTPRTYGVEATVKF
ncbi:MAG: TonB-dependent receptor, partial [Alphaproteobacteria bacterium]|nr:TonB-dependent receptor [Alphaproteobacteria bacterium]